MTTLSAGSRFRAALAAEKPLQVAGCINAYCARMAERTGFKAIYLSGGGVAAGSLGVPDRGISTLDDVLTDVRRISNITHLPLLVDADTGFGDLDEWFAVADIDQLDVVAVKRLEESVKATRARVAEMDVVAIARAYFLDERNQFGCAETTFIVLKGAYGLDDPMDAGAAMALNGGIAYSGGTCSASCSPASAT